MIRYRCRCRRRHRCLFLTLIETVAFINRLSSVATLYTFRFSVGFSYPHYETRTDGFFFRSLSPSFSSVAFFSLGRVLKIV